MFTKAAPLVWSLGFCLVAALQDDVPEMADDLMRRGRWIWPTTSCTHIGGYNDYGTAGPALTFTQTICCTNTVKQTTTSTIISIPTTTSTLFVTDTVTAHGMNKTVATSTHYITSTESKNVTDIITDYSTITVTTTSTSLWPTFTGSAAHAAAPSDTNSPSVAKRHEKRQHTVFLTTTVTATRPSDTSATISSISTAIASNGTATGGSANTTMTNSLSGTGVPVTLPPPPSTSNSTAKNFTSSSASILPTRPPIAPAEICIIDKCSKVTETCTEVVTRCSGMSTVTKTSTVVTTTTPYHSINATTTSTIFTTSSITTTVTTTANSTTFQTVAYTPVPTFYLASSENKVVADGVRLQNVADDETDESRPTFTGDGTLYTLQSVNNISRLIEVGTDQVANTDGRPLAAMYFDSAAKLFTPGYNPCDCSINVANTPNLTLYCTCGPANVFQTGASGDLLWIYGNPNTIYSNSTSSNSTSPITGPSASPSNSMNGTATATGTPTLQKRQATQVQVTSTAESSISVPTLGAGDPNAQGLSFELPIVQIVEQH